MPGCSSAPVASEELCLFCKDQKDGSLSETEEKNAFHNTMKYGSSDGSILNTLPAVYKPDCESKMFVEKERYCTRLTHLNAIIFSPIETKNVRTRSARKRMQTKVLPPLEFKEEIKMVFYISIKLVANYFRKILCYHQVSLSIWGCLFLMKFKLTGIRKKTFLLNILILIEWKSKTIALKQY